MSYDDIDVDDEDSAVDARSRNRRLSGRHPLQDPALVQAFLAQGDAWMTVGGLYVAIDEMTPGHALATANFVLDRARATALTLLAVGDERVTEQIACSSQGARLILIDAPLVQALLERGRAASPTELPWTTALAGR